MMEYFETTDGPDGCPQLTMIYHESDKISADYYGISLETMSLLTREEKIDFLMKNTKGEDVEMPVAQQVIADESSSAN